MSVFGSMGVIGGDEVCAEGYGGEIIRVDIDIIVEAVVGVVAILSLESLLLLLEVELVLELVIMFMSLLFPLVRTNPLLYTDVTGRSIIQ
jgi:hypothetical protein